MVKAEELTVQGNQTMGIHFAHDGKVGAIAGVWQDWQARSN